MKMTFRWYGENDKVTLQQIRQIPGVCGVVSAVYDVAPGGLWSVESINKIKNAANAAGLDFTVVESVPVPEEIKLGGKDAARLIQVYCENVRRLGAAGIDCICYNFMPVFDWFRTNLKNELPEGANGLSYDEKELAKLDPLNGEFTLPGWDESYTKSELKTLMERYADIGEEGLWENIGTFLKEVIPVAHEAGVNMAIHPDDPPWGIFGLPRIITNEANIERFLKIVDMPENGLTFCTGSLGASEDNDLPKMAIKFAKRIHFAHLRNIKITGYREFHEVAHPTAEGSLDMFAIVKGLVEGGFDGYVRPDHGRMIWGETGKGGYGLYDRALGAAYLNGLFEGVKRCGASQ